MRIPALCIDRSSIPKGYWLQDSLSRLKSLAVCNLLPKLAERNSPPPIEQGLPCMADSTYTPPKVWTYDSENGGRFASINRPAAGAREERELPVGKNPFQLYSL